MRADLINSIGLGVVWIGFDELRISVFESGEGLMVGELNAREEGCGGGGDKETAALGN